MKRHHVPAVVLSGITLVLIVVDRVVMAVTGEATVVTDDSQGSTGAALAVGLLMALTFGAMGLVVRCEAPRFATARRAARLARPVLTYGLFAMSAAFLVLSPLQTVLADEDSPAVQVSGLVGLVAIGAVLVSALVLGLALVGRNPLGLGGRVLAALGPVLVATAGLALVAPAAATPMYGTMVLLAGVTLIGVRAPDERQPATRAATASPTAAV